jgi:hypothetical protein
MALSSLLLGILLFQGPGDGWVLVPSTRQVKRLYWDLFQTTEVWLSLIPEDPAGTHPLVTLIFQAFFPGRAERDPYSGLPREPKGPPARLVVRAQGLPLTVISHLTLRLEIDDKTIDLTGSAAKFRFVYPCPPGDGCAANAVEAELEPSVLRSLATARVVKGEALGFPITLTADDQRSLAAFAARIGSKGD